MRSEQIKPPSRDRRTSLSVSLSGAKSRLGSMQDRPKGAEGKSCDRNKTGINLRPRNGKCDSDNLTASKYNGSPFDKNQFKFTVGLDYLTLNLMGKLPIEADEVEVLESGFRFINLERPSKHFLTMFNLYYDENLIGVLLAYPREGNKLKPETIQLKIENQNFYDGTDLKQILQNFFSSFLVEFKNITRIDVYLDSYGFQNGCSLNAFDYLLDEGKVISNTRVKDKSKYSNKKDGAFQTTGFGWGSRSTGRYLRIYNKTLELSQGSKPWIENHHRINGLVDQDVFRFEYELRNAFVKNIQQFDWLHIFDPEGIFELLDIARKDHFSFVIEDGKSRNARKEPFELFDWSSLRELPEFVYDYSWKRKKPIGYSRRSMQVLVGSLFKHYVFNFQPESTLKEIKEILNHYELSFWFEKQVGEYLNKYLSLRKTHYEFDHSKLNLLRI
ncbi:MAG: hypothetical protein JXQ96_20750 [Cyclobacteriaceae bacterium]